MQRTTRREFIATSAGAIAAALCGSPAFAQNNPNMRIGLVTYLWGQHWDLPTLIANCEASKVLGVELRVDHAHGVGPSLSKSQRADVKARFADTPVVLVGMGTNQEYDSPDPAVLKENIDGTKAWLQLSHDVGGSGVKVKPNDFHESVPREKTIEQIGKSLNEVAAYGADLGQEIRLEVHGSCSELPTIKAIMDVADHPNVGVCWNSNDQDLQGQGLEHNFNLVKDRFGHTAHVRELNIGDYPYAKLMQLFADMHYDGWVLLEARTKPEDPVAALIEQREIFEKMVADAT